jgi:predicted RNA-binding Zn-ribbon protein involved in translation (DUF1610 family)
LPLPIDLSYNFVTRDPAPTGTPTRQENPREHRLTWFAKIRLKVLAYVAGVLLAALGIASIATIPAWPLVGAAVAVAAVVIHKAAHRLSEPTCLGCGRDIRDLPLGEHGVICPDCGHISRKPDRLA